MRVPEPARQFAAAGLSACCPAITAEPPPFPSIYLAYEAQPFAHMPSPGEPITGSGSRLSFSDLLPDANGVSMEL